MKRLLFLLSLLIAAWIGVHLSLGLADVRAANNTPGKAKANISIAARVESFTEWADPSPVIFEVDWSGPITKTNQRQIASKQLILYTNTDANVCARPALHDGILTMGSSTLDTSYRLTGAVNSPDNRFKPAHEFFSSQNVYTITHQAGTGAYSINLDVQVSSPPSAAPEQGLYTCGVTLTAGW